MPDWFDEMEADEQPLPPSVPAGTVVALTIRETPEGPACNITVPPGLDGEVRARAEAWGRVELREMVRADFTDPDSTWQMFFMDDGRVAWQKFGSLHYLEEP